MAASGSARRPRPVDDAGRRQPVDDDEILEWGALVISPRAHQAWVHERPVDLSHLQFTVLCELVRAAGRVASYAQLRAASGLTSPRAVQIAVSRLRRRLGNGTPDIVNLRGVGYLVREASPRVSEPRAG